SGWARRYDESNFRPLCTVCHNKRHKRFQKRIPRGG
ncbi:MAG: HNH endonuclease, partial [Ruminococcus sp.]|nr:HNH endonuclease [Ruminococcus sp.]